MKRFLFAVSMAASLASTAAVHGGDLPLNPKRDVTFISTSDSHFRTKERPGNTEWDHETITEMNKIQSMKWPQGLGGDAFDKPRGVMVLGDCIDDGDMNRNGRNWSAEQYDLFLKDFGFDGTDGLLKYPVYEGFGNHDGPPAGSEKFGFSFQAQLKKRNELRKQKGMISNLSANGLHYSFDWDDIHFVQLNIYPAEKQNPKVHYSPEWHNPQGSLTFLKEDLARNIGNSGRPVVLMSHCGFDTDWWIPEDWAAAYYAAKRYNVVLYLYGHSGTGLRDWAPPGETKKWTCINDGQTTAGFFMIQIKGDRLRAVYRTREHVKYVKVKGADVTREWDGTWGWKFPLEKSLSGSEGKPPKVAGHS